MLALFTKMSYNLDILQSQDILRHCRIDIIPQFHGKQFYI